MKMLFASVVVAAGLLTAINVYAQTAAPAGATATCKDGTTYSGASKRGACSGHGGIKTWIGAASATPAAPAATPAATTSPAKATRKTKAAAPAPMVAAPAPAAAPMAAAPAAAPTPKAASTPKSTAMPTQAAAGGGPGQVWVNSSTKVYHCPSDRWYGKTKSGSYMSESDAKAKGFHAADGKGCQ